MLLVVRDMLQRERVCERGYRGYHTKICYDVLGLVNRAKNYASDVRQEERGTQLPLEN